MTNDQETEGQIALAKLQELSDLYYPEEIEAFKKEKPGFKEEYEKLEKLANAECQRLYFEKNEQQREATGIDIDFLADVMTGKMMQAMREVLSEFAGVIPVVSRQIAEQVVELVEGKDEE